MIRIFLIGRKAQLLDKHFAGFVAYGFGLWIAIQFTVSIGVNSGLFPTKGLTLPFMSYGGSHLLTEFLGLGILMGMRGSSRTVHKSITENEMIGM